MLPDASEGWDGFALLVDDVERYVGTGLNFSLASLQVGIPHFFRLAVSGYLTDIFTHLTTPLIVYKRWSGGRFHDASGALAEWHMG